MTPQVLAKTQDLNRSDWLALRRRGIGGSDAAAICGLNPWKSPIRVYLEKVGEIQHEEAGEAAYWGTVLEDVVAGEWSKRNDKRIRRVNRILQHPEHAWMIANIDRDVVGESAGLEVKTTSAFSKDQYEDGQVPDYVAVQCHHYMAVTGAARWYWAVLIGGQRYLDGVIERDEEAIRHLIQIERGFWTLVENGTPPALDGSSDASEVLKVLYPEARESEIELPPDAGSLIERYLSARARMDEAEYEAEEAANLLKAMLGEHECGRIGERRVTWKNVTTVRLDSKGLKAQDPDVYAKYARETSYRRFLVT